MSIQKWHFGKLIVLWSWGGLFSALALTDVMTAKSSESPGFHLGELVVVVIVLIVLSVITWRWLGGKETPSETPIK